MSATPEGGGIDGRFDELEARLSELRRSIGLTTGSPAAAPASADGTSPVPEVPASRAPSVASAPSPAPSPVPAPTPLAVSVPAAATPPAPPAPRPSVASPSTGGVPLRDLRPPLPPRTAEPVGDVPAPVPAAAAATSTRPVAVPSDPGPRPSGRAPAADAGTASPSLRSVPSEPAPAAARPLPPTAPGAPVPVAPASVAVAGASTPSPWSVAPGAAPSAPVPARARADSTDRTDLDGGPVTLDGIEVDSTEVEGADVDEGWDDVALTPPRGRRPRRWSPDGAAPGATVATPAPAAPLAPLPPLPPLPRSPDRPVAPPLPPVAPAAAAPLPSVTPPAPSAPVAPAAVARSTRPVLPPIEWSRPPGPITVTDLDAVVADDEVEDLPVAPAEDVTPRARREQRRRAEPAPVGAAWTADERVDGDDLDEDAGFSARRLRALDVIAVAVVAFLLLVGIVVGIEGARDGRPTFVLDDRVAPVLRAGDVAYFVPLQAVPSVGAVVQAVVADQLVLGRILKVDGEEVRLSLDLDGGTAIVPSTALVGELRTVVPMVGWPRTWWSRLPADPLAAVGLVLTLVIIGWALIRSMRLARVAPPLDDLSDAWELPVAPDERVR